MSVRGGQTVTFQFTTRNFSTGALTNADTLPNAFLYINNVLNGAAVTVANSGTGRYRCSVVLPALSPGDGVEVLVLATVAAVTDGDVMWRDSCDIALDGLGQVALTGSGLDAVQIEAGLNARQGLGLILATQVGIDTFDGTTVTFAAAGHPGTVRVTATVSTNNTRTGIVLSPAA